MEILKNPHSVEVNKLFKILNSSQSGLSQQQASDLHLKYGQNILPQKKGTNLILLFLTQFNSILIYILLAAAGVSFFSNHVADAVIILMVVLLNGIIGFVQEIRAEKSITALQQMLVVECSVLRDGQFRRLPAAGLVPGDVIEVVEGDYLPADCRIISGDNLQTNEASLTGEAYPVSKNLTVASEQTPLADRRNMLWMGSYLVSGQGLALVVGTGANTQIGAIATEINQTKEGQSHFAQETKKLTFQIGIVVLILASIIFLVGVFGRGQDIFETLIFAIATLVSGIPEGLPAVLAVVLAVGAQRLAVKKVIIRNLPATETLGAVNVICTDKTGTLTENKMTVERIWLASNEEILLSGRGWETTGQFSLGGNLVNPLEHKTLEKLLKVGLWSHTSIVVEKPNEESEVIGDPTEVALYVAAAKAEIERNKIFTVTQKLPFSSDYKFRASVIQNHSGSGILCVIGAPETIVNRSTYSASGRAEISVSKMDTTLKQKVLQQIDEASKQGLRLIALAYKENWQDGQIDLDEVNNLIFLGLAIIQDPIRQGVKDAVIKAKKAGIRTIMMTGDHQQTAQFIASQTAIIGSEKFQNKLSLTQTDLEKLSDSEFGQAVTKINVFARLTPQMKFKITETLQVKGLIVAMTGDGVNDAPALKKADIGISMGKIGTDVARQASDMVLADDNFVSIVDAVEQGRVVFKNIRRASYYLLSTNCAEALTILAALFLGLPAPLTASQILWINLVTDGLNGIALATEKGNNELSEPPRLKNQSILDKGVLPYILMISSLMAVFSMILFVNTQAKDLEVARSMVYTAIVSVQLFNMISLRNLKGSVLAVGLFSNKYILATFAGSLSLASLAVYLPGLNSLLNLQAYPIWQFAVILLISSLGFWLAEAYKRIKYGRG